MKIDTGDTLYEPMSRNTGEVISVIEHPDGKIIKIRWRLDGQLPHDTELFYKKSNVVFAMVYINTLQQINADKRYEKDVQLIYFLCPNSLHF